ncbi:peptidoglycan DD-metalloendopeptidase family protein [Leeuwenhoekiella sp. W20_SRS_FM14]|uniref:peptidoglycan DD-metalloendopeptidase family protein n=1 Tax=Leeuwenhoekiella sp. W20_SRS_FM14 TaxID=3240270 RepID=UPI003F9BA2E3
MKNLFLRFVVCAFVLLMVSCDKLTKATDFITQPTAREIYARNFKTDSIPYTLWKTAFTNALKDSLTIASPYLESGRFNPERFPVYSYDFRLERGRSYTFALQTDTLNPLVFIDLYEKTSDSLAYFNLIEQAEYNSKKLRFSTKKEGNYKIVVQPQLGAQSTFTFSLSSTLAYSFPVAGISEKAIQSYWGASRDGGKRSHEGVDIFADRGTPVLASVDGIVGRTGNRGLGGKQVWLRESLFGNSLYYAHLDSIIARDGLRVKRGDTLGLVGNTGNARTTPPHLHFGIYGRGTGAINPLSFLKQETRLKTAEVDADAPLDYLIKNKVANLRNSASAKAKKIGVLNRNDTIQVLGVVNDWLHIATQDSQRAYIHQSLVKPF